jgi:glycosyltransferase involved in cell wall biosynthesis
MESPNSGKTNKGPFADVAVIISTYNRPQALDLVLEGFSRQRLRPRQILVGDDGSGDATREVLAAWQGRGLPVEHCWHDDRGYRKSVIMNQTLRRVTEPVCLFTDGDCVPLPGFVADHVNFFEAGHVLAGPRILAGPRLTDALERRTESCFDRGWTWWLQQRAAGQINRLLPLIRLPDGSWRKKKPHKWELVRGCNFSVATDHVWRAGGFEENLYGWGPDDSDLAVRMINAGVRVKSLRCAAPVLHLWHKEESRVTLEQNRSYLASALAEKRTRAVAGFSDEEIAGLLDR